ncbi:MAG: hypothetical protein KIT09_22125 [Bryobacteraceae bacterium]|nr:hypothetical protein [Bryobacteraceae bacterium]
MHHVVLERWSRGGSFLHARDPRVKILAALAILVAIATTPPQTAAPFAAYAILLIGASAASGLPVSGVLARAAVVLPFSATFAAISWVSGDPERAAALVLKSYLSATAALVLIGTTPMPKLLLGLEKLGAPRMIVLVALFLYRYLFIVSEQAQHMLQAAAARGGLFGKARPLRFRAAGGAVAVLFGHSYQRAVGIHRAMLSRGFEGRLMPASALALTVTDALFLGGALVLAFASRLSAGAGL